MQTDLSSGIAEQSTADTVAQKPAGPDAVIHDAAQVQAGLEAGLKESGSQEIDDFIYLISHDVRASIRALIELPQWIKEDLTEAGVRINGPVSDSIDLMDRHTGRLDRMLVDLLAFSRVGRLQTTRPLKVAEALDDVLEHTRVPQGFSILRQIDCPQVVMGDRDLPTLLGALISNAIKHHDRESGQILVRTRRAGAEVIISVIDDGPGIPAQFRERVFAPMTTLRPRDEVEGSGMGLATLRKIARHYGGDVVLSDAPAGRGCAVELRILSDRSA